MSEDSLKPLEENMTRKMMTLRRNKTKIQIKMDLVCDTDRLYPDREVKPKNKPK